MPVGVVGEKIDSVGFGKNLSVADAAVGRQKLVAATLPLGPEILNPRAGAQFHHIKGRHRQPA